MEDLPKKLRLPKIRREDLVITGLVVIALAIPLTVALAGVRQELRKRAAPATGSIEIYDPDGDGITTTTEVTLKLAAPTQQASLLKPNLQVPQAHAAPACMLTANPNPCIVQPGDDSCTSTIQWTTDDDIYIYVYSTPHPEGQLFSHVGAGSYTQDATWINCTDTFTFKGIGVNDGIEKCHLNVTGRCASPPTPTPTTSPSACYDSDGLDQYTKGYVDYSGSDPTAPPAGRYWDECSGSGKQVNEKWCNDRGLPATGVFNCDYGCEDGACRRSGATPTPTPTQPPAPTPTPSPTVVAMKISNDGNFSGASEEDFATTKSWTLTAGDGVKTVYAWFKWSDGTWTQRVQDTITLQTTGPTPTPTPTSTPTPTPPPGVTPTPTPTTPPGVTPTPTPTPTPPAGEPTAYCDILQITCTPHQSWALTSLHAFGHDSQGNEVAFLFKISGSSGDVYPALVVGGLGGGGYVVDPYGEHFWVFTTNDLNNLFHLYTACCRPGTFTVEARVASVTRHPLTGQPTVMDNWSSPRSVTFNVHYGGPGATLTDATCDPVESGEIPESQKPVISNLTHRITSDTGRYASITITWNTDVEANCKAWLEVLTGTGYTQTAQSAISTGISHSYSETVRYATGGANLRYRAMCWKGYGHTFETTSLSDWGYFTLPSGGGGGGLSSTQADLNNSGDVDIGDWGALVGDYGQEGTDLPADFNANGEVDILDASRFIEAYRTYAQ